VVKNKVRSILTRQSQPQEAYQGQYVAQRVIGNLKEVRMLLNKWRICLLSVGIICALYQLIDSNRRVVAKRQLVSN